MSAQTVTTIEQLLAAGDSGRCELVRGDLVMMTPAGGEHGYVVMNLSVPLALFVRQHRLGRVYGAETGFVLQRDPDTVRAPDAAFVRTDRLPVRRARGFVEGPPDLAVEVLSPDDRPAEVQAKIDDYLEAGAQAVWTVDLDRRTLTIYRADRGSRTLGINDVLDGEEYLPGFRLAIIEVFA